jgi:peptidoglycan hydrolase CwlO-like protein
MRSLFISALVLGLATSVAGCSNTSGPGASDPSGSESDDPVVALKAVGEGIQKDIDGLMEPIKNAQQIIDDVAKLPADLKASAGVKFDAKALMAEAQKIVNGEASNIDLLKLEGDAKANVAAKFEKLKNLVTTIKTLDEKVKALGEKIKDATLKIPELGAKATAKVTLTLSNPLAGADAKAEAEAKKKTIDEIVNGFKDKASEWTKTVTDLPPKAKDLPGKMATAFKG